jgi:uncharacterized protein
MSEVPTKRVTTSIPLPSVSPGCKRSLIYHTYGPKGGQRAYIQASLHADELPGMLVSHHLIKMLDAAASKGEIKNEIIIVPYANPIGLAQGFMDLHLGRFSFETMINFNRNWHDFSKEAATSALPRLSMTDPDNNVRVIREALAKAVDEVPALREEEVMKKELFRLAVVADVCLDLHCDDKSLMHMYTHDKCWPQLRDLYDQLQAHVCMLATCSGGNPFDEACTQVWETLAGQFPAFPIPMACQSATVELRGQGDVSDEMAAKDARALFKFLQGRGYIVAESNAAADDFAYGGSAAGSVSPALQVGLRSPRMPDAYPLTATDTVKVAVAGIVAWKVGLGYMVTKGQLVGEIVNIDDVDAERVPIVAGCDGLVFAMAGQLCRPGQAIMKIAGKEPLDYRKGNLLSL